MPTPRMPQLEGNPIWFNLATPDVQGAKTFYSGVFGWEWADVAMSGGNTYYMAIRGDANIAGMFKEHEAVEPKGVWVNHVYVEDAEATIARIRANGGDVVSSPNNADGWGITATVKTHEGAIFGLWQSIKGHGADIFGEVGSACWIEYHTQDLAGAKDFYSAVFSAGFDEFQIPTDDSPGSEFTMTMLSINGEQMSCAFAELPDKSMPATWATYFMVEDIHESVAKARSLGAELTFGVMDVPPGSFASLVDPQGVPFSLWQSAG